MDNNHKHDINTPDDDTDGDEHNANNNDNMAARSNENRLHGTRCDTIITRLRAAHTALWDP